MNRVFVLPGILLAFSTIVRASPPPPLPWETSSFSVLLGSQMVEFKMECPRGKLTRLSATRGQQVADVPIDRLAGLSIPQTCSGISSQASIETEGSPNLIGVELTVELSREYINEKLLISFDVKRFKFTKARRLLSYPPEDAQDTAVQL